MTQVFYESPEQANLATRSRDEFQWSFFNSWKVAAQPNDRPPAPAAVTANLAQPSFTPSASAQRSTLRRKQQAMFKVWSQDRHD